jgi:hypothetical protein
MNQSLLMSCQIVIVHSAACFQFDSHSLCMRRDRAPHPCLTVRLCSRLPTKIPRASVRRHRSQLGRSLRRALTWPFMDLPTGPWFLGPEEGIVQAAPARGAMMRFGATVVAERPSIASRRSIDDPPHPRRSAGGSTPCAPDGRWRAAPNPPSGARDAGRGLRAVDFRAARSSGRTDKPARGRSRSRPARPGGLLDPGHVTFDDARKGSEMLQPGRQEVEHGQGTKAEDDQTRAGRGP